MIIRPTYANAVRLSSDIEDLKAGPVTEPFLFEKKIFLTKDRMIMIKKNIMHMVYSNPLLIRQERGRQWAFVSLMSPKLPQSNDDRRLSFEAYT